LLAAVFLLVMTTVIVVNAAHPAPIFAWAVSFAAATAVEVVPGLPVDPTGEQFVERAHSTAIRLGAVIQSATKVVELETRGAVKRVGLMDGNAVEAHSVIVATGTEYPGLGFPGFREFTRLGVYLGVPETLRDREVFSRASGMLRLQRPCASPITAGG
jgi:thioredoxin reductase